MSTPSGCREIAFRRRVFEMIGLYDPHAITYESPEGRPFPLSEGTPIKQLL